MALVVRCGTHGVPKRGRKSAYVFVAEPLGGSADPGITCGNHGCKNPGLVFMDVIDAAKYKKGVRTFRLPFHPAKKVTLAEGGRFLSEIKGSK